MEGKEANGKMYSFNKKKREKREKKTIKSALRGKSFNNQGRLEYARMNVYPFILWGGCSAQLCFAFPNPKINKFVSSVSFFKFRIRFIKLQASKKLAVCL